MMKMVQMAHALSATGADVLARARSKDHEDVFVAVWFRE